jgi:hypothetical protein
MYMLELQNRCVKFGVNGQRAQIINVRDNETLVLSSFGQEWQSSTPGRQRGMMVVQVWRYQKQS